MTYDVVAAITSGFRRAPDQAWRQPDRARQESPKSARQIENEAMQKVVDVLVNGVKESNRNIARCMAYLEANARHAAAPCPAPPPVGGDLPKPPAPKPSTAIKAPGRDGKPRRWFTLYEIQNMDKAVADAILTGTIHPPKKTVEVHGAFGDLKIPWRAAMWDFDEAVRLAARRRP